jgi:hypothetical protein
MVIVALSSCSCYKNQVILAGRASAAARQKARTIASVQLARARIPRLRVPPLLTHGPNPPAAVAGPNFGGCRRPRGAAEGRVRQLLLCLLELTLPASTSVLPSAGRVPAGDAAGRQQGLGLRRAAASDGSDRALPYLVLRLLLRLLLHPSLRLRSFVALAVAPAVAPCSSGPLACCGPVPERHRSALCAPARAQDPASHCLGRPRRWASGVSSSSSSLAPPSAAAAALSPTAAHRAPRQAGWAGAFAAPPARTAGRAPASAAVWRRVSRHVRQPLCARATLH